MTLNSNAKIVFFNILQLNLPTQIMYLLYKFIKFAFAYVQYLIYNL